MNITTLAIIEFEDKYEVSIFWRCKKNIPNVEEGEDCPFSPDNKDGEHDNLFGKTWCSYTICEHNTLDNEAIAISDTREVAARIDPNEARELSMPLKKDLAALKEQE